MKLSLLFQIGLVTILLDRMSSAENILFLSLPYYGHINPMVRVAGELTDYGHSSYILNIDRFRGKFDPVKDGVNFIITDEFPEYKLFNDTAMNFLLYPGKYGLEELFHALHELCDRYLFDEELFSKLKSFNASLAIVDSNFVSNCLAVFAYRLDIPFILLGAQNQFNIHRTPWAISVFPNFFVHQVKASSFTKRILNTVHNFMGYLNSASGSPGKDIKIYAPERPEISFDELLRQAKLHIVDTDYFLTPPLPALPNVKYIGGIAVQPAGPLKGKILKFINASKHGVIVVSPGSLVSWGIHVEKMIEAFSKIKYDVVWKHSNRSYSRPNVLITKWLPQNNLLGHPNTKLFITHCGNSGQYESLYHAVPMIGFPVLADQPINSNNIVLKGFGISMDLNNFTVDELVRNIDEVIENPKYKKNIAKMSEIFRSQDLPSARVARLLNEIVKYGGDHLKSQIQDIPLYAFLMLDILAVLFTVGFVILFLTAFLLRKCFFLVSRMKKTKTE